MSLYALEIQVMVSIISSFFSAVKLYQSSLPLAMAQAVCGGVAGWALTYGPAGEFGDNVVYYKKQIRRIHNVASADIKHADKYVGSISDSGLALGGFYYFDKMSLPDLTDFVFSQAIGALLSYPGPRCT